MSRYYNKDKLKEELDISNIYDLLVEFGGEPEYVNDKTLVSQTICHNMPGEGSRKLYYYENDGEGLFHCYTACDSSFDIFELVIKVFKVQHQQEFELWDAMNYVASYFGFGGIEPTAPKEVSQEQLIFQRYSDLASQIESPRVIIPTLKEYNPIILTRFSYPIIAPWEKEGISREVCRTNLIGYYAGGEQITIPHFDINNRLVGVRGRALSEEEADRFGKYRPLKICGLTYSHPLSANLYNLNNSKDNIRRASAAIVFESEKSCLMYQSIYGKENDISVACCGFNISSMQMELLRSLGIREVIIAFDRQFQEFNDPEFTRLTNKLVAMYTKYSKYVVVTCIFDKDKITSYKASPIDEGQEKFEYLLKNRFVPR